MDQLPETIAELEALKKQIEMKQALLKECPEQQFTEGLHLLLDKKNYVIPPPYVTYLQLVRRDKASVIVKSIMENEKLIHFPILMTLLQVWPCSKIALRERLVQLYDSYILHSGPGYALADIINFPVDRVLEACQSHDSSVPLMLLNEQLQVLYKFDMTKFNIEDKNNKATKWLNTNMSSLQFITYVIEESQEIKANIFALALNFLLGRIVSYDDYSIYHFPKDMIRQQMVKGKIEGGHYGIFEKLVTEVNDNGSDYIFSKAILPAFKGIEFDKNLAV